MSLIPSRSTSRKRKAARAASRAGRKVAKAKAVQKAPKTAAAVWTGRRSGRILRGAMITVAGVVTLKAIRRKRAGGAPVDAVSTTPSPPATPVPDPGQPIAGSPINGSAPQPDPAAAPAPDTSAASSTPPHGDKLDVTQPPPGEGEGA